METASLTSAEQSTRRVHSRTLRQTSSAPMKSTSSCSPTARNGANSDGSCRPSSTSTPSTASYLSNRPRQRRLSSSLSRIRRVTTTIFGDIPRQSSSPVCSDSARNGSTRLMSRPCIMPKISSQRFSNRAPLRPSMPSRFSSIFPERRGRNGPTRSDGNRGVCICGYWRRRGID